MEKIQKYIFVIFFFLASFFCLFSCESAPKNLELKKFLGRELWTCTNLRIFENNSILWQNYGHGKILPLGTSVRMIEGNLDVVSFVDNNSNEYKLYWRRDVKSQWEEEMPKYFSKENPEEKIQSMEETWKNYVFGGTIQKGMSREMVLLSRGYPVLPEEYKKEDIWVYYEDQNKKSMVYFENDAVVQVVNL